MSNVRMANGLLVLYSWAVLPWEIICVSPITLETKTPVRHSPPKFLDPQTVVSFILSHNHREDDSTSTTETSGLFLVIRNDSTGTRMARPWFQAAQHRNIMYVSAILRANPRRSQYLFITLCEFLRKQWAYGRSKMWISLRWRQARMKENSFSMIYISKRAYFSASKRVLINRSSINLDCLSRSLNRK